MIIPNVQRFYLVLFLNNFSVLMLVTPAVADQASKENHLIDWEKVNVIGREKNMQLRLVRESVEIRKRQITIPTYKIPTYKITFKLDDFWDGVQFKFVTTKRPETGDGSLELLKFLPLIILAAVVGITCKYLLKRRNCTIWHLIAYCRTARESRLQAAQAARQAAEATSNHHNAGDVFRSYAIVTPVPANLRPPSDVDFRSYAVVTPVTANLRPPPGYDYKSPYVANTSEEVGEYSPPVDDTVDLISAAVPPSIDDPVQGNLSVPSNCSWI